MIIPADEGLEFFKRYSFNIKSDLKKLKISTEEFLNKIREQAIRSGIGLKGKILFGNKEFYSINKVYIDIGNVGKKKGIRVIALVIKVENVAIIIHAYSKSKKKDLSKKEYSNLKDILRELSL